MCPETRAPPGFAGFSGGLLGVFGDAAGRFFVVMKPIFHMKRMLFQGNARLFHMTNALVGRAKAGGHVRQAVRHASKTFCDVTKWFCAVAQSLAYMKKHICHMRGRVCRMSGKFFHLKMGAVGVAEDSFHVKKDVCHMTNGLFDMPGFFLRVGRQIILIKYCL